MPTNVAEVGADALREAKSNLDSDYVPSDDEPFMNERQQEYFRNLLLAWKKSILTESESTLAHLQDGPLREPDLADRASSETDWAIELRTRDRQRKLIAKIDSALRRIDEGEYGSPASASDRDDDAGSAGAPRTQRADFARRLIPIGTEAPLFTIR